jgi:uncharacterized membrane protein (UPF0127 family)
VFLVFGLLMQGASCTPAPSPEGLDQLGSVDLRIKEQPFRLWIADDHAEQAQGLMYVTAERMAPLPDGTERGMIFVFDHEREMSFWMRNTIIPLDIAYLDTSGNVVKTYTMAPLDDRPGQYSSIDPARFAIEVNAGVLQRIGLKEGDTLAVPPNLLKRKP